MRLRLAADIDNVPDLDFNGLFHVFEGPVDVGNLNFGRRSVLGVQWLPLQSLAKQMQCLSQLKDETYVACDNECDISAIQETRHICDV